MLDPTTNIVGTAAAVICIALGIMLLTATKEFLQNNKYLNGGKNRKGSALIIYRFTGIQMLSMGVILLIALAAFYFEILPLALIAVLVVIVIPFACSSYMKRGKRFK